MNSITPYRSPGELAPKPKDTFGLLRAPKEHVCSQPSWFARMIYTLIGAPIREKSLFRCAICKVTYKLELRHDDTLCTWTSLSNRDAKEEWKRLGGDIAEDEKK